MQIAYRNNKFILKLLKLMIIYIQQ